MLFLSGATLIGVFALVSSLVQLITTNEMRGRVMSVYNVAFRGGMPMGNLIAGELVGLFTAPVVLTVNGVVLMGVALYFLVENARAVLSIGERAFWPYIVSGLFIILIFWSRSVELKPDA